MQSQTLLNDELASLIDQGKLIVDQFRERAVTSREARQFLNELRVRDEYQRLATASIEKQVVDNKLQALEDELTFIAQSRRIIQGRQR